MLFRIRPAALKQQRAVRVWQIAIRTWEKYKIPHAVRWWSSKVFGILGLDPGGVSWVGKKDTTKFFPNVSISLRKFSSSLIIVFNFGPPYFQDWPFFTTGIFEETICCLLSFSNSIYIQREYIVLLKILIVYGFFLLLLLLLLLFLFSLSLPSPLPPGH